MTPPPDFSALSSSEKDALIATLLARVEELVARVAALEAENAALRERLDLPPKTPTNSSTPPSRGHKAGGAAKGGGAKTKPKGKAHAGAHRPLHPDPTRRRDVFADHCPHCQAEVTGVAQAPLQAYDRIEIPEITPDVVRVTLHGGTCPCCHGRFRATPPAGLEPGSPFGPNLRAFVLYLRFGQAIPYQRLERLMHDLFGLAISEGALANMLADSAPTFEAQANRIKERLLAGAIVQSDETSARVGKRTFWTWVFHHGDSACFVVRPSRGKKVVADFLGEVRPDFWVSDRLGAQMGWATKEHQACLAHLLRDIQYAIDAGDDAFAPAVLALLGRAIRIGRRRHSLADSTLAAYHGRLQTRLDQLLKIVPATKPGHKLQRIIKRFRRNLFVFVTNRDIPPTNNGSEQALRPAVVFRKITNCFRSEWGANLYADVRSVIETARRRGIALLKAIRLTLDGSPLPAGT
ncbi:MAG: IS66 family transposase [Kiloniellales bacterium]|nr:IS66 family transposase [Kiloniellales bacterium]